MSPEQILNLIQGFVGSVQGCDKVRDLKVERQKNPTAKARSDGSSARSFFDLSVVAYRKR